MKAWRGGGGGGCRGGGGTVSAGRTHLAVAVFNEPGVAPADGVDIDDVVDVALLDGADGERALAVHSLVLEVVHDFSHHDGEHFVLVRGAAGQARHRRRVGC